MFQDVLVDTGSTVSLLDAELASRIEGQLVTIEPVSIRSVNDGRLNVTAAISCCNEIDGRSFPEHRFLTVPGIITSAILGTDFLSMARATISFSNDVWQLSFPSLDACPETLPQLVNPRVQLTSKTVIPPMHAMTLQATCAEFGSDQGYACLVEALPTFMNKHPQLEVGSILFQPGCRELVIPVANA